MARQDFFQMEDIDELYGHAYICCGTLQSTNDNAAQTAFLARPHTYFHRQRVHLYMPFSQTRVFILKAGLFFPFIVMAISDISEGSCSYIHDRRSITKIYLAKFHSKLKVLWITTFYLLILLQACHSITTLFSGDRNIFGNGSVPKCRIEAWYWVDNTKFISITGRQYNKLI